MVQEHKAGNVRKQGKTKDRPAVGHHCHAPESSMADNLFGVVEEAIDASVQELTRMLIQEKVTIKPF